MLPDDAHPGALVWHNFVIRRPGTGRPWVATELLHGAQEIRNPESVRVYGETWAKLWDAAAHGDEARAPIRKAHR